MGQVMSMKRKMTSMIKALTSMKQGMVNISVKHEELKAELRDEMKEEVRINLS